MQQLARPQVSVIVPTYEEAENIVEVIERLHGSLADLAHEIIVVDDDSPDRTWERAESIGDPSVRVIRRIGERGLASAVLDGMSAAHGEALAVIDGDLQHDETVLAQMTAAVLQDGADVCVGARMAEEGPPQRAPLRRFATAAGTALVRAVLPLLRRTGDPLSGFFVVSRGLYERVAPGARSRLREYKILWAFLARERDLVVTDVEYRFGERRAGQTKLSGSVLLDDLVNAFAMRLGAWISPVVLKYSAVGASGVAVSLAVFAAGELVGLPTISPGFTAAVNPIALSVLVGIQASIVTNFVANNYFTFYDRRYRGWHLLRGLLAFQAVSMVGVLVQVAVFQLLQRNQFLSGWAYDDAGAAVNNAIGLAVAATVNFALNSTITWNRRRTRTGGRADPPTETLSTPAAVDAVG